MQWFAQRLHSKQSSSEKYLPADKCLISALLMTTTAPSFDPAPKMLLEVGVYRPNAYMDGIRGSYNHVRQGMTADSELFKRSPELNFQCFNIACTVIHSCSESNPPTSLLAVASAPHHLLSTATDVKPDGITEQAETIQSRASHRPQTARLL